MRYICSSRPSMVKVLKSSQALDHTGSQQLATFHQIDAPSNEGREAWKPYSRTCRTKWLLLCMSSQKVCEIRTPFRGEDKEAVISKIETFTFSCRHRYLQAIASLANQLNYQNHINLMMDCVKKSCFLMPEYNSASLFLFDCSLTRPWLMRLLVRSFGPWKQFEAATSPVHPLCTYFLTIPPYRLLPVQFTQSCREFATIVYANNLLV